MAVHLAQFTADMALTFGARGGIFLAGGLAANILPPAAKTVFGAELTARIAPRLGDGARQHLRAFNMIDQLQQIDRCQNIQPRPRPDRLFPCCARRTRNAIGS